MINCLRDDMKRRGFCRLQKGLWTWQWGWWALFLAPGETVRGLSGGVL